MKHTSWDIAAEVSKWTNLLPKAFPVSRSSIQAQIVSSPKKDPLLSQSGYNTNRFILGWMPDIDFGFSTEPIAVSHEILVKYDLYIFLFSGTYALGRVFVPATP